MFKEELIKSNFRSILRRRHVTVKNTLQISKGEVSLTPSISKGLPSIYSENRVLFLLVVGLVRIEGKGQQIDISSHPYH